jgi:hypothetical protein
MLPFFFFAVTDTVAVEVDFETVYVHEWGVIDFDEIFDTAAGAEWGYLNDRGILEPYSEVEVEAPVVWFHGAECTGTLTIEANDGSFTTLLPHPDSLSQEEGEQSALPDNIISQKAVWNDISLTWYPPESEESIPVAFEAGGFGWAMPLWRDIPANYVTVPGAAYLDKFLYYECFVNTVIEYSSDQGVYGYLGDALLFREENGELCAHLADLDGSVNISGEVLSRVQILEVLCGWGGNMFKSQEIEALLATWEPALRQRCLLQDQNVILFPLSPEQVEAVSTISFVPDQGNPVEYTRLFLGMGEV